MTTERFLVTGAYGCIGAWVVHELLAGGSAVTTFDLSTDPRRLRLLLSDQEIAAVPHVAGDISTSTRSSGCSTSVRSPTSSTLPRSRCRSAAPIRRSGRG